MSNVPMDPAILLPDMQIEEETPREDVLEQGQEELEQALMELAEELARKQQEEEDTKRETYDKLANSIESKLVTRMGTRGRKESEWMEALQLYYGSLSSNGFIEEIIPQDRPQSERGIIVVRRSTSYGTSARPLSPRLLRTSSLLETRIGISIPQPSMTI